MAKAEAPRMKGIVVQRETSAPPEVNIKSYVDLLWVVGAGVVGVSLLCVAAGIALANPASAALQPQSIIQIAIANVNTAAALTMEAFPQNLITPTVIPSNTLASNAISFSPTVTFLPPTITASATFIPLTSTRRPGQGSNSNPNPSSTPTQAPTETSSPLPPPTLTAVPTQTSSPVPPPTITDTPKPTKTPKPTRTRTPIPPPTDTLVPPTDTLAPPPTDTAVPPPTDTSTPPPTDTSAPPPTDTAAPAATDTPSGP